LPERDSIAAFVKGTLGCACPEEVFDRIEVLRHAEAGGFPLEARIVIGERLLVYIARAPEEATLRALAVAGRRDRDAHGLNRFRLVVFSDDADSRGGELAERFASLLGDDEKAHLHVIDGGSPLLAAVLEK
jgi:hypothetical protein